MQRPNLSERPTVAVKTEFKTEMESKKPHHKLGQFINPAYHFAKLKEDIAAFRLALRNRGQVILRTDFDHMRDLFRGKLLGCFFLSGPTSFFALGLGYLIQRYYDNVFVGIIATIALGILFTTGAYQLLWWADTASLYRDSENRGFRSHFLAVQRDLWPVHSHGIGVALTLLLITAPIHTGGVAVLHTIAPKFAAVFPAGVVLFIVDLVFIQGPFLRSMGNCFERQAKVLAARYQIEESSVPKSA